MTTRFADMLASDAGSIFSTPSYLRIAIPSWRFVGIRLVRKPAPGPKPSGLSREEIQTLFDGDLNPKTQRKLTEFEEREQALQSRIRDALYAEPISKASDLPARRA
jgi:hypothetical protein